MAENQIYGTENNDFLLDTAAQDEIFALNGNDRIETTEGDDIVHGDLGIDTLTFDHSSNIDDTPFFLQSYDAYSGEGYLEVGFPESSDYRSISFYSIEKFEFLTGAGNDLIDTNIYYSDDTVDAGVGNDYIFTGKGFDVVDGGYGLDLLDLDFSNNYTGVTSRLIDRHQGEYVSDESVVSFSNIEAVNVIGSQHDDVLLGFAVDSYWSDSEFFISPMVDGGMGYDELVLDYSDSHQDLDISVNFDFFSSTNSIDVVDNSDFIKSLDFSNIEAFNVTTGRGDDDVDLGYDNYSDDTVDTGAGNDTIFTGKGFDVVDGGYGLDLLDLDFSNNYTGVTSRLIDRHQGEYVSDESVVSFSNIEAVNVIGSQHDDVLLGFAVDSYWFDSEFFISPMVDGGMGFDELVLDYSDSHQDLDVQLYADYAATPPITSIDIFDSNGAIKSLDFSNIEAFNVTTGRGDDDVDLGYDNYSDDTVDTGAGNDTIFTGKGFDVVDGGYGFDSLNLDFSNNYTGVTSRLIDRHQGEYVSDESVVSFSNIEAVNVIGSQHDDVLLGFAVDSYWFDSEFFISPMVDGGMGYDELVLDYSDSHQDLDISVNFDFFSSTNSINVVDNSDFIKSLDFSNIEAFNVTTGRGDDDVDLGYDNYSDDTVDTGAGNDTIFTGKGFDLVDGGYGFDSLNLDFTTSIDGVTSRLYADGGGVYTSSDSLTEFSNIEAIALTGSPKDDLLFGLEGQDNIFGDLGADTIIGGKGTDYLDGGMGNDSIKGGDDDDLLFGGAGTDTIRGESGNDSIYGNEDRDLLFGYENEDTLHGGLGDDLLKGGDGDDLLFGGEGKDVLFGDAGIDIFALESDSSFDIVKDFSDGIDLFGLTNGLNFADLNIVNNSAGSAAVIKNASDNNRVIAFVTGVDAVDITSADFINI